MPVVVYISSPKQDYCNQRNPMQIEIMLKYEYSYAAFEKTFFGSKNLISIGSIKVKQLRRQHYHDYDTGIIERMISLYNFALYFPLIKRRRLYDGHSSNLVTGNKVLILNLSDYESCSYSRTNLACFRTG